MDHLRPTWGTPPMLALNRRPQTPANPAIRYESKFQPWVGKRHASRPSRLKSPPWGARASDCLVQRWIIRCSRRPWLSARRLSRFLQRVFVGAPPMPPRSGAATYRARPFCGSGCGPATRSEICNLARGLPPARGSVWWRSRSKRFIGAACGVRAQHQKTSLVGCHVGQSRRHGPDSACFDLLPAAARQRSDGHAHSIEVRPTDQRGDLAGRDLQIDDRTVANIGSAARQAVLEITVRLQMPTGASSLLEIEPQGVAAETKGDGKEKGTSQDVTDWRPWVGPGRRGPSQVPTARP